MPCLKMDSANIAGGKAYKEMNATINSSTGFKVTCGFKPTAIIIGCFCNSTFFGFKYDADTSTTQYTQSWGTEGHNRTIGDPTYGGFASIDNDGFTLNSVTTYEYANIIAIA